MLDFMCTYAILFNEQHMEYILFRALLFFYGDVTDSTGVDWA